MSVSKAMELPKNDNTPRKRVRPRKKKLYENILTQIEFYFSDANLTKDRFLGSLVNKDPYVPIETFNRFNKIRAITTDVSVIARALKNSTFLEISEDKLKVKRKTPLVPYNNAIRTVYVESIPVTATLEWLQNVFSEFGQVAYISLPKFKNSQKNKGFGFIEFSKPEEAQKCITTFTKMGCKLPTNMPPEELSSIKMFSVEDSVIESPIKKDENNEEHEPPKKKAKKHKEKKLKNLELKLNNEPECEKKADVSKQKNIDIVIKEKITCQDIEIKEKLINQNIDIKEEGDSHDKGKLDEEMVRKKKVRKKLSKDKAAKNSLNKNEAPPGALWGLQVLPKSEWTYLRNKYLNLQRKYMKEIKNKLHNNRLDYSSIPAPAASSVDIERVKHAPKSSFDKQPGLFVKQILAEPCLDVRLTKRTIRSNIHALHVDVKEGQLEAIIRFDSSKAAEEYCALTNRAQVLSGEEEEQQWAAAESARSRVRGRLRLLARSAAHAETVSAPAPASPQPTHTHIRFDE